MAKQENANTSMILFAIFLILLLVLAGILWHLCWDSLLLVALRGFGA